MTEEYTEKETEEMCHQLDRANVHETKAPVTAEAKQTYVVDGSLMMPQCDNY